MAVMRFLLCLLWAFIRIKRISTGLNDKTFTGPLARPQERLLLKQKEICKKVRCQLLIRKLICHDVHRSAEWLRQATLRQFDVGSAHPWRSHHVLSFFSRVLFKFKHQPMLRRKQKENKTYERIFKPDIEILKKISSRGYV